MDIVNALRHATATASNDDVTEPGTELRQRQIGRIDAMLGGIEEIERLRAERAWQPISTAPKDGTKILAHCQPCHIDGGPMSFDYVNVVWWRSEKFKDSQWKWRHALNDSAAEPTHWMPLPPPPRVGAP